MEEKVDLGQMARQAPGGADYVPPTDLVPLPSRGLVYPLSSPLHHAESLEVRSMTARDENILTSRALLRQGKAITTLLRACIVNKSVDVDKMLVGDRNAVLAAIRITGYGADYDITIDCPACERKVEHRFDLSRLPIRNLGTEPVRDGENLFLFKLPSGREALFRLMTGELDAELSTITERRRKATGGSIDSVVTDQLLFQVVQIDGEKDPTVLERLIASMPARDSLELRSHMDEIEPGVEMLQEFRCKYCGEESEVDVPMGAEFFWPSRKGRRRRR